MVFSANLQQQASGLLAACRAKGAMVATAESCTGGLIAALLTEIAGSSDVVDRGFVTYSNEAKQQMLGVCEALIAQHGAVSEQVACAMARGALEHSRAQLSVAVTGIAGPGGGNADKPVGLVYIATGIKGGAVQCEEHQFNGDRVAVRLATVEQALQQMMVRL